MHLLPLITTRAQRRTKQRDRIPGSITVLVQVQSTEFWHVSDVRQM